MSILKFLQVYSEISVFLQVYSEISVFSLTLFSFVRDFFEFSCYSPSGFFVFFVFFLGVFLDLPESLVFS